MVFVNSLLIVFNFLIILCNSGSGENALWIGGNKKCD